MKKNVFAVPEAMSKQYWYPLKKIGGVKNANLDAAIKLERRNPLLSTRAQRTSQLDLGQETNALTLEKDPFANACSRLRGVESCRATGNNAQKCETGK